MERVSIEELRLRGPRFADEFVGREALQRLEPLGEVVGIDEVGEVPFELHVGVVVEAPDGCLLRTLDQGLPGRSDAKQPARNPGQFSVLQHRVGPSF